MTTRETLRDSSVLDSEFDYYVERYGIDNVTESLVELNPDAAQYFHARRKVLAAEKKAVEQSAFSEEQTRRDIQQTKVKLAALNADQQGAAAMNCSVRWTFAATSRTRRHLNDSFQDLCPTVAWFEFQRRTRALSACRGAIQPMAEGSDSYVVNDAGTIQARRGQRPGRSTAMSLVTSVALT